MTKGRAIGAGIAALIRLTGGTTVGVGLLVLSPFLALGALIWAIMLIVDVRDPSRRGPEREPVSPWLYAGIGLLLAIFLGIGSCWGVGLFALTHM